MAAESTEGPVELSQIVNQYKQELQDYCGGYLNFLQEKSREFSQTVDAAGNLMKEAEKDKGKRLEFGVVRPLKNMAPVELSNMMLLQYFSWLAIMMSAYSFAFSILSTALEPLIALTFTGIQSMFLVVLIPTIAYKKINPGMDVQSRYYLFIFALLEGIVVGHLFPDYHLALPPPFILPICVAISAQLFSKKPVASRIQFLGFSLVLHLALNFALGLTVTNGMFVFFLAVLLQAICALLTLQYYMEHWDKDYTKNPYIYLFSFVCAHVCIHVLLLVLFADDGKQ